MLSLSLGLVALFASSPRRLRHEPGTRNHPSANGNINQLLYSVVRRRVHISF